MKCKYCPKEIKEKSIFRLFGAREKFKIESNRELWEHIKRKHIKKTK